MGEVVLSVERLLPRREEELLPAIDALDATVFGVRRRAMRRALEAMPGGTPQDDFAPAARGCRGDSDVETAVGKRERMKP